VLTIGKLADHTGVTVRAIRHYHQIGLLAEPARDASGYRRYDAQAVVDLIRIKTLSGAGVPLARIEGLLTAEPAKFAAAIAQIDKSLENRIAELAQHRRQIAELASGERLFLPEEVVSLLDQLRDLGVSARTVHLERDGWILLAAMSPELVAVWVREKQAALADPEFRQLYLACDEAFGWDPGDPRLEGLANAVVAWSNQPGRDRGQAPSPAADEAGQLPVVSALLNSRIADRAPAWQRLAELSAGRMRSGLAASPDSR
jgi:DNA-binding transcriptional MerR regulator